MTITVREREVKLAAPPGFALPPLTDAGGGIFAGPDVVLELDATYYDTEDLRLCRAGASLRRRSDEGWSVKLPARDGDGTDMLSRDEHHFEATTDEPPEAALDLVTALVRGAPVDAVARLLTIRTRVAVHGSDGRQVAEVVDDAVQVLEGAAVESKFRELEIELADGASDGQRAALVARLRSVGAGAPDPTPKIVRALGPVAAAPPDVVVPDVGRGAGSDELLRAAIAGAVAKLMAHDPGVRLGDDPEDVHQARVATRRLRSHLRTFRTLVDEQWAGDLRDELRWLGEVLGGVRDTEVLVDRLEAQLRRLPEVDQAPAERLVGTLREERDRRRTLLLEALRSERYITLLDRLVLAARRPRLLLRIDEQDDTELLRDLVRRPWGHLRAAVEALPDEPADADLHAVRITAKRTRYTIEAVAPAFGKRARSFARAVTAVQDVLGEHQDAVVAAEWLRKAAAGTDDEAVGFAAGQLAALEHADAVAARAAWPGAWKQARARRLRDWL